MWSMAAYIASWNSSPLAAPAAGLAPWRLVERAEPLVRALAAALEGPAWRRRGEQLVHETAIVEPGAVLKGPLVIGPGCLVAAGATLRGGNWLDEACIVGPGAELKASFLFAGCRLAHFNFVGDSVLGCGVNLEAGSVVANHRNERPGQPIRVRLGDALYGTGVQKFGALLGDGVRLGANAVVAPGALLVPRTVVGRTALLDQDPG
ncbi:MAG: LpxA family transferase [Burkholderiales bacterium]|nr:LpxA family transferase [Burkholderiales bacterium]